MTASAINVPSGPIVFVAMNDRISEAIEASGKTKAEISRLCGVTNAAVTHWLTGDTKTLKADQALALARATGYRADWLLHGRGPKLANDAAEPYWPFPKIALARFAALDRDDQGYCQRVLLDAVEKCEKSKNTEAEFLELLQKEQKDYFPKQRFRKTSNGR